MSWHLADQIERSRPSDPARDYCLWDYRMPVPPAPGALRSSALLYQSFEAAGVSDRMLAFCAAVQKTWGRFNTVFGVKWGGGQLSWEFYFYDYGRDQRRLGMADFLRGTQGLITSPLIPDDALPYFMFSVEITEAHLTGQPLDQIDIYMGNPGSNVSSGICYGLTEAGLEMRNFYFFFDAASEMEAIRGKITESIHMPYVKVDMDALLWPQMNGVQTIVVANKRHRDGIYFSRIRASQLLHFLERLDFPASSRTFLHDNMAELDHHLYDVGWDFESDDKGRITPVKGSYYGLL